MADGATTGSNCRYVIGGFLDQTKGSSHPGCVATASVLTLIAQRFVLASLLPRLPYMTRLDFFTVGSTILVLLEKSLSQMTTF